MRRLSPSGSKDIQIRILRAIDDLCERHGIEYCLAYGSLLGAVRHGGFIPWDDDIDIMVPRRDYSRLAQIVAASSAGLLWHDVSTAEDWPLPFAKVSIEGTLLEQGAWFAPRIGINVDVWPLDDLPNGKFAAKLFAVGVHALRAYWRLSLLEVRQGRSRVKNLVVMCTRWARPYPAARWLDRFAARHKTGKSVGVLTGNYVWSIRREAVFPRSTIMFEGELCYAPNDPATVLQELYGLDYMTPPPERERVGHAQTAYELEL